MGKKRLRKKMVSKGIRSKVSNGTVRAVNSAREAVDIHLNKVEAWAKGLNPWLTVPNPNKAETNKLFIKVRANSYYGPWRYSREARAEEA